MYFRLLIELPQAGLHNVSSHVKKKKKNFTHLPPLFFICWCKFDINSCIFCVITVKYSVSIQTLTVLSHQAFGYLPDFRMLKWHSANKMSKMHDYKHAWEKTTTGCLHIYRVNTVVLTLPQVTMEMFLPTPNSDVQTTSRSAPDRCFIFVNRRPLFLKDLDKVCSIEYFAGVYFALSLKNKRTTSLGKTSF